MDGWDGWMDGWMDGPQDILRILLNFDVLILFYNLFLVFPDLLLLHMRDYTMLPLEIWIR